MEYNNKFCPKCNILYDKFIHTPLILPNCNHSLCSKCICEMLIKNNNNIICPIDKIINKEIKPIEKTKINKLLIENANNKKYNSNTNKLKTESEEMSLGNENSSKNDDLKTENNLLNKNNNNLNLSFSSTFLNLKNKNENNSICSLHLLPNNIICVNDRIKICLQCSKNSLHSNHELLTEDELLEQIEKLIDKYQEIEKKNISFIENLSGKNINKLIDEKIEKIKHTINITKNEMINNINIQIEQILYYLDFRKNELKNKFYSKYKEINQLKEDIFNWKKITCNKLDKLNEINNISLECFKLLDNDPEKNLNYLFKKGMSINEKFNDLNDIMNNLVKFCNNGINIIPNNDLIEKIKFKYTKKNSNKNNFIVNSKLFNIIENDGLTNELNFIKFYFENENRQSLNKSFGYKNNTDQKLKDEKNKEIKENLNPIITFKQNYNNNIYNNFNNYNYNYQNAISPNINKKITFEKKTKSKSPNNKTNNLKGEDTFKKEENYKKINYYKINPNKINSLRDSKNHGKNVINDSLNKKKIIPSSARNKKESKIKKENISTRKKNTTINKTSHNIRNANEFDSSKLSKIMNPIENVSYQDSFNNISNLYYLSSIFDKNINNNEMDNIKGKIENDNSFLNFSRINCNTSKDNLKIKNNDINNLIISQLKKESPNFNGNNMNGNNMVIFCNMIQKMNNIKFSELLMEHCDLNDDDVNLLIKTLIKKSVIFEMLDLSWNKITDESGLCILDLIKENKTLNILLLNNNSFSLSLKKKLESYVNLGRKGLGNIKLCI